MQKPQNLRVAVPGGTSGTPSSNRPCQSWHESSVKRLGDGTKLGFAWLGDTSAYQHTLVFFHGVPGSRLDAGRLAPAAKRLGVRILALDRSGMGRSSYIRHRTIWDEARRLTKVLLESFKLGEFYIMGYSGGTPYALAVSGMVPPENLKGTVIVAGLAPWDITKEHMKPDKLKAAQAANSSLGGGIYKSLSWLLFTPTAHIPFVWNKLFGRYAVRKDAQQAALVRLPGMKEVFVASKAEVMRNPAGALHEVRLCQQSWGFDLKKNVTEKPIQLWYAREDDIIPFAVARKLRMLLPNATLDELQGVNHDTILCLQGDRILREMLGQGSLGTIFPRRTSRASLGSAPSGKP